jgi:hypothetical protein
VSATIKIYGSPTATDRAEAYVDFNKGGVTDLTLLDG